MSVNVMARRGFMLAVWLVLGMAGPWAQAAPEVNAASATPAAATPATRTDGPQSVAHGLFGDVQVYRPKGEVRQFVMLLSGGEALVASDAELALTMANSGAMVAAVAVAPFYRRLEAQSGQCAYAGGAFENLAHFIQAFDKLPTYLTPMLVGSNGAGDLAYAVLAQAPAGTFASALSLGFCPRLSFTKAPLCANNALRWQPVKEGNAVDLLPATQLASPWTVLQVPVNRSADKSADKAAAKPGDKDEDDDCSPAVTQSFVQRVPQALWLPQDTAATTPSRGPTNFEIAYARLASQRVALEAPPAQLADLPIVELPVPAGTPGNRLAVLLSGDGGWAGIDKGIASAFVAQGVPVAGFDSLRYFWTARKPEGLAADLDRLIRYYAARWKRSEIILIGYSQGADVLPFALNRMPHRTRASVRLTALLGLGQKASFEFHVTNWIGASGDQPILPEAEKLLAATTLCVYGSDERNSLCPLLAPLHAQALLLSGGHHFGGDYGALAQRILDVAAAR